MSRTILVFAFISALLFDGACATKSTSPAGKVIKSAKSGDLTINIESASGELKRGHNDLILTFADDSAKPVDVGAASLNFHMPTMGSMAEMNDKATLTTTGTPGRFNASVEIQVAGTWEAQVKYQGSHGSGESSMTVQAK